MKWSREKDYHGYRTYGNEAAGEVDGGILAGLIGAVKSALASLVRPTPSPAVLNKGRNRGFSTLGARSGSADSPFPTEPANVTPARRP